MTERNVMPLGGSGSAVAVDTTLTQAGQAADAKATGEAINQIADDISNLQAAIDIQYRSHVHTATSSDTVDALFVDWWNQVYKDGADKVDLLNRWFGNVLVDDRVHGAKLPLFATSQAYAGELIDDSAGLTCTPSTESTAGNDPFAHLPQFWTLEVSADKNADGTITVYAIEHIDDIADVRSGEHLCQVLQKNTYWREWEENGYQYTKQRCTPADGYSRWQGANAQGVEFEFCARPKYAAGMRNGVITDGTGLPPVTGTSQQMSVLKWRERSSMYAGGMHTVAKWQLVMFRLKYGVKGNSGTIEGCLNYNYQYTAAVSEAGVERIILTTAQAKNLHVGSNVILGDKGSGTSADRSVASMSNLCKNKRIRAIEDVTIDGTVYKAVYIDNGGVTFDTVAATTYITTMPYWSGWNDTVKGYDGSRYDPKSGKEPGLIQRTEFGIGAYAIIADEFLNWSKDADGNYLLDIYICRDQSKVATDGKISANYEKVDGATITLPSTQSSWVWIYIEDMLVCATNWPKAISSAAGSGTGCRSAVNVAPGSGVRASWCFANLNNGSNGGFGARNSNNSPSNANWNGSVGALTLSTEQQWQCVFYHCTMHSSLMCENSLKTAPCSGAVNQMRLTGG